MRMNTRNLFFCLTVPFINAVLVPEDHQEADGVIFTKYDNETLMEYVRRIECIFCDDEFLCGPYSHKTKFAEAIKYKCFGCVKCWTDENCLLYGDCCPGQLLTKEYGVCASTIITKTRFTPPTQGHRVISKCPTDFSNPRGKADCEFYDEQSRNISKNTPVTSASGFTFRNRYCAECHRVSSYTSWETGVGCQEEFSLSSVLTYEQMMEVIWNHDSCTIKVTQPAKFSNSLRKCDIYTGILMAKNCNVTGRWSEYDAITEKACRSYTRPFRFMNRYFNNVFCFLCNSDIYQSMEACKTYRPSFQERDSPGVLMAFSSILNFNLDDPKVDSIYAAQECGRGRVFDTMKGICRSVHCMPGWWLSKGNCMKVIATKDWLEYYITVVYEVLQPLDHSGWNKDLSSSDLTETLYATFEKMESMYTYLKSILTEEIWNYSPRNYTDTPETSSPKTVNGSAVLKVERLYGYKIRYGFFKRNDEGFKKLRTEIWDLLVRKYNFDIQNHTFSIIPDVNATNAFEQSGRVQVENMDNIVIVPTVGRRNLPQGDLKKSIPFNSLLFCPYIVLDERDFSILDNATLLLKQTNILLHKDFFRLQNRSSARVCADNFTNILDRERLKYERQPDFNLVHGFVSLLCTCFSILCLTVTLVIYSAVKSMRTLAGLNNMSLVSTLIVAQAIYQFGVGQNLENRFACEAVGIAAHYFWLAVIFWMNVCCFHMYRVFGNRNMTAVDHSTTRRQLYYKHALYAFSMPFCIVLVCVIVSLSISSGASLGHAGSYCFIADKLLVGTTFALPIGVLVSINIILFIKAVFHIRRQAKHAAILGTDRHYVHVYFRLSTITGLTWVFGFVHQLTGVEAFGYLFTALNASQGVFIFIAFVCTKTTIRHCVKLKRQSENTPRSYQTTESTYI